MNADDGILALLAGRLSARADELVARQMQALRQFRAYDRVPRDDLVRSCHRNVARVVALLEQRDGLPASIEENERMSGRRRALQGVPTEEVVEAYRVVLSLLRDAFIKEATELGMDPGQVLGGAVRLWDLTDRYSSVLVAARQQVDIETARHDERHRMAFLQRLIIGVDPDAVARISAAYGIVPDREYWVVRGRQRDDDAPGLSRHLEAPGGSVGFQPLVAPLDDDVVGILAERPRPLADTVLAVAGPVAPAGIPHAFSEATRVLQVALRYGRTGVVDSSSLSVRVAVEQQGELGEQLFRRYVAGILDRDTPGSDALLAALQTYLAMRRSVAETARVLCIHQNTVRYRLDRYQRLASADLADTDVLVEIWWALEYMRIRRG
jgi:putative transposase